jgi:hypothetical protein
MGASLLCSVEISQPVGSIGAVSVPSSDREARSNGIGPNVQEGTRRPFGVPGCDLSPRNGIDLWRGSELGGVSERPHSQPPLVVGKPHVD